MTGPDTTRVRRSGVLVVVICVLVLAACGKSTIVPAGAERSVAETVTQHTQFRLRASAVNCPDGIEAKPGVTFTCHFTGPGGRPYAAAMRVVRVNGAKVTFYISTRPTR